MCTKRPKNFLNKNTHTHCLFHVEFKTERKNRVFVIYLKASKSNFKIIFIPCKIQLLIWISKRKVMFYTTVPVRVFQYHYLPVGKMEAE
jgi:hypothetical protein